MNKNILVAISVLVILSLGVSAYGADTDVVIQQGSEASDECAISNTCIIPSNITINPGDTVTFFNADSGSFLASNHQLRGGAPGTDWDGDLFTGFIKAGSPASHTYNDLGVFPFHDPKQPWIEGVVIVEESGLDTFSVTNLRILDDTQQPVDTVPTNEVYFVAIDLENTLSTPFNFYMEIDIQGPSAELETTTVGMAGNDFSVLRHPAIPLKPGAHTVTVKTFDNEIDRNQLAPFRSLAFTIDGPEHFTSTELALIVTDLQNQIEVLEARVVELEAVTGFMIEPAVVTGFAAAEIVASSDTSVD